MTGHEDWDTTKLQNKNRKHWPKQADTLHYRTWTYPLLTLLCSALPGQRDVSMDSHLQLMLSNIPDRDRAVYLNQLVSAKGFLDNHWILFKSSLSCRRSRWKLCSTSSPSIILNPNQLWACNPQYHNFSTKKVALTQSSGPQLVKQQTTGQIPWNSA